MRVSEIPQVYRRFTYLMDNVDWISLLIRHAEKYENFPDGDSGYDVSLTPRGIKMSQEIGRSFESVNLRIYTSPLKRCVQTAENIAIGACTVSDIIPTNMLGDPGPYVVNPPVAEKYFREHGTKNLIRMYLNGRVFGGFTSVSEGSARLLRHIVKNSKANMVTVFTSHDAIVIPFFSNYTNHDFSNTWIDYMDGGLIYSIKNRIYVEFRNTIREVVV